MDSSAPLLPPAPVVKQLPLSHRNNPTLLIIVLLITTVLVSTAVSLAIFNTGKGVTRQPINEVTENPFEDAALTLENPFNESTYSTVNPFENATTVNPFDAFEDTTSMNTTEYQNPF